MCIEIMNNNVEISQSKNTKKVSYSIKKVLQKLFKKQQHQVITENPKNSEKASSLESLESLENMRNADIEMEAVSLESYENAANECISFAHNSVSYELEDYDLADMPTVPVHFVRTNHGTFFWTAASDFAADNDLIEPLYCSTNTQIAVQQLQDRWAQA